jgi:acyl dehydratase
VKRIAFPVEAGHILQFARAIGDSNPVYRDASYAAGTELRGVIAPPTFTAASSHYDPDYPLRPKLGQAWFGSGREASGARREASGGLHAEQHYEYHRPIRPGDVLVAETSDERTWEKQGRRGGKLLFSERVTVYRDRDRNPVVTERLVAVRPERVVDPEAAS